jgi:transcriptional regulator with XRE-family HTH domain
MILMGRKSIREDKSVYFKAREEAGLTRAQASELIGTMTESRLEKIETGKVAIYPEDVVDLANAYKRQDLCNHYCTHECKIGKGTAPEVKMSSLPEIVLGMLSALNSLNNQKERFIDITADGVISEDEMDDFLAIQKQLEQIDTTVEALKLWVSNKIS